MIKNLLETKPATLSRHHSYRYKSVLLISHFQSHLLPVQVYHWFTEMHLRCGSLAFYDFQPLSVVKPELLSPDPIPPGLVVQGDDVQRGVTQTLDFRVPVVHQVNLE